MFKKLSSITIALLALMTICRAQEEIEPYLKTTDFTFENAFENVKNKEKVFKTGGDWVPYPKYSERNKWEDITKGCSRQLIAAGEKRLNHQWFNMSASQYLEYEKTGSRALFNKEEANRVALKELVLAELAEGKGRFMNQIIDGVWSFSQKWTWSHPQHTRYQKSRRALPVYDERPITYHSAVAGALLSLTWYFFEEEFDKADPSISLALKDAMELNIFTPYMNKHQAGHQWMGFSPEFKTINNHLTNENFYCTLCFLLMMDDQERLIEMLQRSVEIEDKFMSYIKHDGACEEGSAYWKASFGKVYQYCRLLHDFSGGAMDILSNDLIQKMGEYKANAYLGGGFHMNYGDGAVRDYVSPALLYRFGKDTGSKMLRNFALYMMIESSDKFDNRNLANKTSELSLSLETLRYYNDMEEYQKTLLENAENDINILRRQLIDMRSVWYPETEYAIFRNANNWILTAKGAHNAESHNHNDVGSGMLYINSMPIIVDPGIGGYNINTFGTNRYKEWCMRSDWHNLPVINGQVQKNGHEFKATNSLCDIRRNTFSTEIQQAYPDSAACIRWQRQYLLTNNAAKIVDNYSLSSRIAPDVINFIVLGDVEIKGNHILITGYDFKRENSVTVILKYSPSLTPTVEEMPFNDSKLEQRWNSKSIKRITFTSAADAPLTGIYEYVFTVGR